MWIRLVLVCLAWAACHALAADTHPRLLLTPDSVTEIRAGLADAPSFERQLAETERDVIAYFANAPDVPLPRDAGGGYTHEQHKRNATAIHNAGIVYQLTGNRVYADNARDLLLGYAAIYQGLPLHPQQKEQSPGRLFWQSLNEAVWMVYAIQGYDAIVDTLSAEDRDVIESKLLRPLADFLSVESPQTFDKIHNHGTWAVAAVGMAGYVLDDADYVTSALLGLRQDGSAGFLKQLDELFSPDGYYSEGPYYQRYALMPFVVFARSIQTNEPERDIFAYRDGVLIKAVYACIDLSYNRLFFPINDAIKDKGLDTAELTYGIPIAYSATSDKALLSESRLNGPQALTFDGFQAARDKDAGLAVTYPYASRLFRDGPAGEQGALAVLRENQAGKQQALVFKATSQGMGHGHFDKLHWQFYDNASEIVTDYGAARFLNVEQKYGGHYLPENKTWAKQTIAHNTLVVDEQSHFQGELKQAEQFFPTDIYFDGEGDVQVTSAVITSAYPDVAFRRSLIVMNGVAKDAPIVIDVLRTAGGADKHRYDLPLHFNGHIVAISETPSANSTALRPLGSDNGYQHLWLKARVAQAKGASTAISWLHNSRFYTYTTTSSHPASVLFAELGANDPNFNLRREQAVIARVDSDSPVSFASVLEPHGEYNGTLEYTLGNYGVVSDVQVLRLDAYDAVVLTKRDGSQMLVTLSYNAEPDQSHELQYAGRTFIWRGFEGVFALSGTDAETASGR